MTGWLLLSDRDAPVAPALPPLLAEGSLVVELSWPPATGVLLDWRSPEGQALSLFHHPSSGMTLLWRDGGALRRFLLPGPLRADTRAARLVFGWAAAQGRWIMRLDDGGENTVRATAGLNPPILPSAMLAAVCAGQGMARRESSVLWFGVMQGAQPPARLPWVGIAVPVMTPRGPVAAGLLRPGQEVMTRDAGPVILRGLRRMEMPSRGSHAAIVLRAPWYARGCDILVSADQQVAIGGLEAEYLFGDEQVLVPAGCLVDGRSALADNRRATAPGVSLDLGGLHLLDCGGASLLSAHHSPAASQPQAPIRTLQEFEVLPLVSLLRRQRARDAA